MKTHSLINPTGVFVHYCVIDKRLFTGSRLIANSVVNGVSFHHLLALITEKIMVMFICHKAADATHQTDRKKTK